MYARSFEIKLKRLGSGQVSDTSRGFDVVCAPLANLSGHEHRCDWFPFDCDPLSCNGLCAERPVNNWCLDDLDAAIKTTTAFAVDEPEPVLRHDT